MLHELMLKEDYCFIACHSASPTMPPGSCHMIHQVINDQIQEFIMPAWLISHHVWIFQATPQSRQVGDDNQIEAALRRQGHSIAYLQAL